MQPKTSLYKLVKSNIFLLCFLIKDNKIKLVTCFNLHKVISYLKSHSNIFFKGGGFMKKIFSKTKKTNLRGLIFFLLGLFCIVYSLAMKFYHVTFAGFFLLLGLTLCVIGFIRIKLLDSIKSNAVRKTIKAFYFIFIACIILSIIFIEGLILSSASKKETSKPDYIVVLGAGLWGKNPSQILQQRLNASLDVINKYPDVKVVLSGGQGPGETITEAEAMKKYLIDRDVSEDRLLLEEKSTSTLENLSFSYNLIRNTDKVSNFKVTIVTSNFHMYRAQLISKRLGISSYAYASDIENYLKITYFSREYFALIKSIIFDKPTAIAPAEVGMKIDSYKGVAVYNNGKDYTENHGKNYSKDGYFYGYKWQCVEYIKRFYYEAKEHKMPDVYGNAKDFFDVKVKQGNLNKSRGLYQYRNGDNVKPEVDDIIVFNNTKYGHIAIVSDIGKDYIEIVQQNIYDTPRQKLSLTESNGIYTVGTSRKPAGWLRINKV